MAFSKAFTPAVLQQPASTDRVVSGLTAPKRKRLSAAKKEPNKKGRAGLEESATPFASAHIYGLVRRNFFLGDDHGRAVVRAGLLEDGFEFSPAEEEAWWEHMGHALAMLRAKAARAALVESVKAGLWLAHGASAAPCGARRRRCANAPQ